MKLLNLSLLMSTLFVSALRAQTAPSKWGDGPLWGDQKDGTYRNPVLPGDYSDIDAIRVGDDFYAISSTFQFSPGMVILHSRDLVNWQIVGHAVEDLTQLSPELNWDRMNRYGRGIWAGAIRHHAGRFWIYFGTPDEGLFVTSAPDITGPWDKPTSILKERGWDDCCPFWDDDGEAYLVCTHFADGYKIHLFKMTADGKGLVPGSDRVIHQSKGSEANKLYKINGLYYHYFSEVKPEGRVAMMERAKSLDGPWEVRQLNHVNAKVDKEPNQGGLIELPSGKWWFLTHQGTGDWEGRDMCLLPTTWIDGWPIIGKVGNDGVGNMQWRCAKPVAGYPKAPVQSGERFDADRLGPQWEWNYQPRADRWSLKDRPGHLRLRAFKPLKPGDLLTAGNTLTQRVFRSEQGQATVHLDLVGMAEGQFAGLCHFSKDYSMVGVVQEGTTRSLVVKSPAQTIRGPGIASSTLWLRTTWTYDGTARYAYSADGRAFTDIGPTFRLTWSFYRGDRLGLFSFNDKSDSGFVDFDNFECELRPPG